MSEGRIVELSMELRGAAPGIWEAFVQAMLEHADEATKAMMIAPVEMLPRAQGMALAARDIAVLLAEAPARHDKMQALKLGKRHV